MGRCPPAETAMTSSRLLPIGAALALVTGLAGAMPADESEFRDLYRELVEINTTLSVGSCTEAAEAMRRRLLAAGLPAADAEILVPPGLPRDGALVAVLRGREPALKPVLLLAHLDVVEARREEWTRDPFRLVEEDGWFYGRGVSDDKAMAAIFTDTLVRLVRESYRPRRGLKLALTCREETPGAGNTVSWLTTTRPAVLEATFALNEGAGGELDADGRPRALQIQAGEKVYQDFEVEANDVGGHSSRPTASNPIVRLATGLARLGAHRFPIALNPATRGYFEHEATLVDAATARDMRAVLREPADEAAATRLWAANPGWNGMLRTTCVVTLINGGHAPNALPQRVRANINCRILPGVPVADVEREIVRVLADDSLSVHPVGDPGLASPAPPLTARITAPIRAVAATIWPGVPLVPTMTPGATDGRFLNASGVPTYGLSGLFHDADGSHAHGLNERLRVKSLLDGRRFLYELVRRYGELAD